MIYLDSSALVKLAIAEPESPALRRYLARHEARASSALSKVEVLRAVRVQGPAAIARARMVLRRIDLVLIDDELLEDAATLDAGVLRSLDAIHLASARIFGGDLAALVTYDERMARAAERLGLPVQAPE